MTIEPLESRCLLAADPLAASVASQASNAFAVDLYRQLQASDGGSGNLFVSPASITIALAMAYAGARGETAAQIASALHLSGDPASIAQDFGSLLDKLNSPLSDQSQLSVVDALWGQADFPFLQPFLDTLESQYDSGMNFVDFAQDNERARQAINDWVARQTHDKIQDLFPNGSLDAATRMVLTNAIYFNAPWAKGPYSTYDTNFTLSSGAVERVSTMYDTDYYRYMERDGFKVLEIPYAGGLAMDILLPDATIDNSGLSIAALPSDLSNWFSGMSSAHVHFAIPKFTMTDEFELSDQLEALGIEDAFDPNAADFSGMTDAARLLISQVRHKAFIEVNEKGTEAAAATGIGVTVTSVATTPPILFVADHPFLFMIRDLRSGSVLFMGQQADPLKTSGDPAADPITTGPAATPDVDQDGKVLPRDLLQVINYLASHTAENGAGSQAAASTLTTTYNGRNCDVNHSGMVTPTDALIIINAILSAQSAAGPPVSTVPPLSPLFGKDVTYIDLAAGITFATQASTTQSSPINASPFSLAIPSTQVDVGASQTSVVSSPMLLEEADEDG